METETLLKKQNLIQLHYFKLKELNDEKNALLKTIKVFKERFEQLIEFDDEPEQLSLFENMDDFLKVKIIKKIE